MTDDKDPDPPQPALMRQLKQQMSASLPTTDLRVENVYQHWEDPALHIPPIKCRCWFFVALSPAIASIEIEWRWPGGTPTSLHVVLETYSRDESSAWVIEQTAEFRRALERLGFQRRGRYEATWTLPGDGVENVISSVVDSVAGVAKLKPSVLRREELPPGIPWPGSHVVEGLIAAERIDVEANEGSGKTRISVQMGGHTSAQIVTDDTMKFIAWWQSRQETRPKSAQI